MTDHSELDAFISSLGLEYSAQFVPKSKSRNAKEEQPSLNWKVTLRNAGKSFTTDYMQGIGHLPQLPGKVPSLLSREYERVAAESGKLGRYFSPGSRLMLTEKQVAAPLLRDVLYCLVSDSSALDFGSFEEWASDYGYDLDSRSDERVYQACLTVALHLRHLLGEANLIKLREKFQDY